MPDNDRSAPNPEILDQNLQRLLRQAYRPVEAPEAFRRRVLHVMREKQKRGLQRVALRRGSIAATLIVALAIFLVWVSTSPAMTARSETGYWFAAAGQDSVVRRGAGTHALSDGDSIATGADDSVQVATAPQVIEVDALSALQVHADRCHLIYGNATVSADASSSLVTSWLEIRAAGARYEVQMEPPIPADRVPEEGAPEMRRAFIAGGVATVVLVTVLAYHSAGDSADDGKENYVVVEMTHGGTTQLTPGESARFDANGRVAAPTPEDLNSASTDHTQVEPEAWHVSGTVVDEAGVALPNATVEFRPDSDDAMQNATTDESGQFVISVANDTVTGTLTATLDGYAEHSQQWQAPAEEGPAAPSLVIVLTPETGLGGIVLDDNGTPCTGFMVSVQKTDDWSDPIFRRFDSEDGRFYFGGVPAGPYSVSAYAPHHCRSEVTKTNVEAGESRDDIVLTVTAGFPLDGVVYSKQTGEPVRGAIVFCPQGYLPGTVDTVSRAEIDSFVRNASFTDAQGRFALDDLSPGKAVVRVLHPDFKPGDVDIDISERTEPVEIALSSGTGIRGVALDETGLPMSGAAVFVSTFNDPDPRLIQLGMGIVDETGEYSVPHLNPAAYIVVLLRDLENPQAADSQMSYTRLGSDKDAVVDFVLIPEIATMKGQILDEDGNPAAGVTVTAATDEGTDFTFRSGYTDDDGYYEIRNLRLGRAYAIGLSRKPEAGSGIVASVVFEEAKDYTRDYVFYELVVHGKVLDDQKRPIEGADVSIARLEEEGESLGGLTKTDANGAFRLVLPRAGKYGMVVSAPGYVRTLAPPFELDPEERREHEEEFQLEIAAGVEVHVRDASGEAVAGARVLIIGDDGFVRNTGLPPKTDARGIYKYGSLAAGTYTVVVLPEDGEKAVRQVEVSVGSTEKVEVDLPK